MMNPLRFRCIPAVLVAVILVSGTGFTQGANPRIGKTASARHGIVAAGKQEAVTAGCAILRNGGNAADAAVASILVLSVSHIGAFCIGGEVPVIIYDARAGEVKVLSGQGAAPLDTAAISWYFRNGIPGDDIRSAAVPAVVDLCVTLLKHYGTISFEKACADVLTLLDRGGPSWYRDTGSGATIDGISGKSTDTALSAMDRGGRTWQADLASTLRKLIDAEKRTPGSRERKLQAVADRFYRGDIADQLVDWYIERGGFLRKKDLASHTTRIEDPVTTSYRGYDVCKCGPWTQGPYLCQTLRLLEGFDLQSMGLVSANAIHTTVEAMKLALADRDEYYGDPLFADVPIRTLLSDGYTAMRRALIDPERASRTWRPGDPFGMKPVLEKPPRSFPSSGGTTTLVVADRWGNMVAATPSGLGSVEGSGGRTGITHGTRLVIFNTWKDHPNRIEPGKRPRTTLTPTLVLKDGKPIMAISVAGGDMQDQAAIQLIVDRVDFSLGVQDSVSVPRFSTGHFIGSFGQDPLKPGHLALHERIADSVRLELKRRGHDVETTSVNVGGVAILGIDPETGTTHAAGSAALGLD